MNNSFARLIDGMCATLRQEVLTRLDDEYARGQVFGVINLLNTFKARADWSPGFLREQIAAQRVAIDGIAELASTLPATSRPPLSCCPDVPAVATAAELLALRDANNTALSTLVAWIDEARPTLPPDLTGGIDKLLLSALRAEVDIELKHSPRPLFAEMSSGREA